MTPREMILVFIFAGCREMHSFVFGSGFCHLCSFWKIGLPPTYGLKPAAAQQIFLGDRWCLAQSQRRTPCDH